MSDPNSTEAEKNIEIWKVKKLIKSLEAARGNGTSMISLIIPPKDQVSRAAKMLAEEYGTASNIKSRVNRQSVLSAITSTQQRLKLYNKVPPNGLVVYCGEILTQEGKERKVNIDFEPFKPINTSLYLCDNKFHTEALSELLESDQKFGFIIMDGNGALFATLSGNTREIVHKFSVDLPKKHGRGDRPPPDTDEAEMKKALRRFLPPQLLNNIGCFYSQSERHEQASELFEAALDACMKLGEKDEDADVDALVTTISFNLGRSYESRGMLDDAVKVYEELLKRHDDYTDARVRLAYIKLRKFPHKEGPEAVSKLYKENARDLEVRALYGWYLGKVPSRKRSGNINEDDEFRHYKHTLRDHDKHDRYALVGAGNLHLLTAREMRRESDSDKARAMYTKAVEFFEKALSLDPLNAYAAQGIAIALVEDRKDYKTALGIFVKIRDTVKDAHVFVNLGHIYAELRQYSKALENYETALSKEGKSNDPVILACLGRTWLNKGRSEKNLDAYSQALSYAKKASHARTGRAHIHGRAYIHLYVMTANIFLSQALEAAPEQVHYKFNVAFVQIQLASTIYLLPETGRVLQQLVDAQEGLEAAITALDEIAAHPQTPYPKHDMRLPLSSSREKPHAFATSD
ncbi:hypothetical protein BN1708_000837 [Verticillium longisporum]|uniref:eRF1/Pelota-like N-terminal domain-containing protein n=1 Tax=Verticillium longisporum TaxID=100787 RepID=A0A0G4M7R7_VERLO|nr:hypothetical protein BN1708_000837 [Verticillium longisporum]